MPLDEKAIANNKAFRALWASDTISTAGSVVTQLALPIIAVTLLDASAFDMGFLAAASQAPRILLSLYLGAVVGARPKLPLMRLSQLLRALSLLSIPCAYAFGVLSLGQLYTVALLNGALGLAFLYADRALLPKVVHKNQLLDANAKLRFTSTIAQTAGPSLAGAILQVIAAPFLILLDALSYLISWALLGKVHVGEERPNSTDFDSVALTIRRGAKFVLSERTLRALTISSLFATAGAVMVSTLFVLFLLQELGFSAFLVGAVMSAAGVAGVGSAAIAARISHVLGGLRTIILSTAIPVLGYALFCFAPEGGLAVLMVITGQILIGAATPLYQVNEMTLRQTLTPEDLLPTVSSFRTFLAGGIAPIAALTAGLLGESIGVRETLLMASAVFALALVPLLFLPRLKAAG